MQGNETHRSCSCRSNINSSTPRWPIHALTPTGLLHRDALSLDSLMQSLQLPQHLLPRLRQQSIHILPRFSLGRNGLQHPSRDPSTPENLPLHVQHIAVVRHHNGYDGHLRLDREMERSLLERQQVRVIVVRPRALGKDVHGLARRMHLLRCSVESCDSLGSGAAFDKDRFAQRHCHTLAPTPSHPHTLTRLAQHLLNHPKNGTHTKLFLLVTLVYFGNTCPKNSTSNSV